MSTYGTWKGFPREQIPWYPTVDAAKCAGCRKCFEFCSHRVYGWDDQANAPRVIEPFQCVVGCSSCTQECDAQAITFPPLSVLKPFVSAP
jgi:NAD-dependent dihydropyrimidine dehydrogenase PreA subunit